MAEIRDRNQPHQQYRYEYPAGVVYRGGKHYHSSGPSTSQVLAVLTLVPVGGTLLALSGLTLAGTVIGLLVATPLFLIFSPILVPAIIAISTAMMGFLLSGALGLTGLSSLNYLFNRMMGTEQARRRMQDMAGYVGATTKEVGAKTKEVGEKIESKAHEGQVTTATSTARA